MRRLPEIRLKESIRNRWGMPNGYRDVLKVSLPLVASMSSVTLMYFTDRVFLANYSMEAIAAAMPAGIAAFTLIAFFMGVAGYVNVFVAQYTGSQDHERVGAALWQGLYFSVAAGMLLASAAWIAEPLFNLVGHPVEVRELEIVYFRILIWGSGFSLVEWTLACFFSGRGMTRTVMMVNVLGACVNIPLDYALIYGIGFFPELGILGAGIATVTAYATMTVCYAWLVFSDAHEERFRVKSNRKFDVDLFGRLMKYGLPNGVRFFIEIFAFTFFVFIVGRIGTIELAATNIVLTINTLAFLPMLGFTMGIAILVGQAIGNNRPDAAEEATTSTLHITISYMVLVALVFLLAPDLLLYLFASADHEACDVRAIHGLGVVLLKIVAVYCIFDGITLVYAGAIEGAGDTRFVMWMFAVLSTGLMVAPAFLAVEVFHAGLMIPWLSMALYLCVISLVFRWRYVQGKWKRMRVIEAKPLADQGDGESAM